jgi:plastocyanin
MPTAFPARPPLLTAVATLALLGCSASASPTPQPSQTAAAASPSIIPAPSVTAAPTPSPPAGVTSTSVAASVAPKGSLRDEMYSLAYHPGDITVGQGRLVIFLVNPADKSSATHALVIGTAVGQTIVRSDDVPLGGSAVFTVSGLPPGAYVLWCPIDHHAAEGMVGTLTIH